MLQDLFVEWMLDATLDRPNARPIAEWARLRRGGPELESWLGRQRDRCLLRFPQADWLIFDGLRDPVGLLHRLTRAQAPFVPGRPKSRHFLLWTTWAGRWAPQPSVFEIGQVLGAFLACGPELEKAYEGSEGLLQLLDRLQEQSTPEDLRKVQQGLTGLLDWPTRSLKGRVARKLSGLRVPDRGLLDDLLAQLVSAPA